MSFFDELYAQGRPPWDIGRPQPAFVALAEAGDIGRRVLDVGCGTGDLAIFLARRGHEVVGVDGAETAIRRARAKADGVPVDLRVGDAFALEVLGRQFDTVLDCGLFHTFVDRAWPAYRESLGRVLKRGGTLHLMCFSDREPEGGGPRRVTKEDLETAFAPTFWIDRIVETRFETIAGISREAWRMSATYAGDLIAAEQ